MDEATQVVAEGAATQTVEEEVEDVVEHGEDLRDPVGGHEAVLLPGVDWGWPYLLAVQLQVEGGGVRQTQHQCRHRHRDQHRRQLCLDRPGDRDPSR